MNDLQPELRVSDSDRDRVAKALQEHFAQGRLDNEEFNLRVSAAYAAKTTGELTELTRDLPERDLYRLNTGSSPMAAAPTASGVLRDPALVIPWTIWAGVSGLNLMIWFLVWLGQGGGVYPWWIWVAGPWGVVMLAITAAVVLTSGPRDGNGR